jgi:Glycosyl hydrolases family 2, sugar binding domain
MSTHIRHALLASAFLFFTAGSGRAADPISFAGDWRFEIAGNNTEQGPAALTQKIHLPGTIDDARLGPPNTKAPTLEGPWRLSDYAGPAWYQRDIEIPAAWSGQRVTLFLERCRWVTTVWLDDKRIGSHDSLIAPHVYDLGTDIAPGKHRLTICVDNTDKIQLGKFVSALRGGTWGNMNGIVGRIELAATPPVWLDAVQVYPDVDQKLARVVVKIGNATGKAGSGTLKAGTITAPVTWDEKGGKAELEVDMAGAKLWDEFSPNLTELTVTLGEHQRTIRFGMRKFAAKGTQFTLNDRPIFLRGTLECSVFPLTGYPPTDVESWRKTYRIVKSYGLNHIRFHSWCPPEAAFAAADIEGILVQAEGPVSANLVSKNEERDAFLTAEYQRIVDTYGNHPSFCLPVFWSPVWFPDQKPNTMGLLCDPKHPLFSQFPTEMHTNWQWYHLMQHSRLFVLDDTPADYRPMVQVSDNFSRNHKLGVVFETRVGSGQLLVCGFDLSNPQNPDITVQQWMTSLYSYVGSANFKPSAEITSGTLDALFAVAPAKPAQSKR